MMRQIQIVLHTFFFAFILQETQICIGKSKELHKWIRNNNVTYSMSSNPPTDFFLILFTPCMFFLSKHRPTYALRDTPFVTYIICYMFRHRLPEDGTSVSRSAHFGCYFLHHLPFSSVVQEYFTRCSYKLLNPAGYVMHQQFNIQQLYVLPTLYLCVLYLSENRQRHVSLTA